MLQMRELRLERPEVAHAGLELTAGPGGLIPGPI